MSSIISAVKTLFDREPPKPTLKLVVISGADNLQELPKGFFNVECASGRKSLGYNGSFYSFDVGETVVDGKRITLDKKREELPTVKLDYRSQSAQTVLGHTIIETDADDFEVGWAGAPPSPGVLLR